MFQIKQLINPNDIIISTVDFKNFNYSFITDNNMNPSFFIYWPCTAPTNNMKSNTLCPNVL